MKKNSKEFFRQVKKQTEKVVDSVQQFADETKEKIDIYQAFKKEAMKIKKVTSEFINLDLPIYGMIDDQMASMTFRAKDSLEVNEMLMIGKKYFKVEYIDDKIIQVPIFINGFEYQVDCKIAVLARV
ncbi:MAG: hypothetical protein K9L02_01010 [Acholeplasmataceae bacterium]|nr:hypothetical protein [Acholeplasmataceae bacterium]